MVSDGGGGVIHDAHAEGLTHHHGLGRQQSSLLLTLYGHIAFDDFIKSLKID